MMADSPNFVIWQPGDNTRLAGLAQYHYRMAFNDMGEPMFQVFNTCRHFLRTVPSLVYDEKHVEDVDTTMEDHIYDECRYVLMENPISPPTPRPIEIPKLNPLDSGQKLHIFR